MTPQEQAPADRREEDFQRACEVAALDVLCEHREKTWRLSEEQDAYDKWLAEEASK